MTENITVAVIGLALKNLREEGFNATGFDRNSYVGGLWQYSTQEQTSVMETTVVNISKERACFTDFPFPNDVPSHPTAAQVQQYLVAYMKHFKLEAHVRLETTIHQLAFDEERQKWMFEMEGEGTQYFDKVVVATGGMVGRANVPKIEGVEKFGGISIHSQAFKKPGEFEGKRVMVVGFSNSAADTATQLVGVADKVFMAHRHGARILPRRIDGVPIDHTHSLRLFTIQSLIIRFFPRLGERLFDSFIKRMQNKSFTIQSQWCPEPVGKVPLVSDKLVPCLEDGSISSVAGIKRILSDTSVELQDGTSVDVEAIIWCTGYKSDFSMIDAQFDPTCYPQPWLDAAGSNGKPLFRLYHNIFSVKKPDSLAFLGNVHITLSGFHIFDMASMAVAQVWAKKSLLPSLPAMNAAVDKHHEWLADEAKRTSNVSPGQCDAGAWVGAMDELAGTGVNEYLGYGLKGWLFWLRHRNFCNMLMGGIWSPHIHRVFEGKRKRWDGAGEAIVKVNERPGPLSNSRGRRNRHLISISFHAQPPRALKDRPKPRQRDRGSLLTAHLPICPSAHLPTIQAETRPTRYKPRAIESSAAETPSPSPSPSPTTTAAMATQTLHGSCACGRNRYVIEIPSQQAQQAELRYDNTSASRHHSASPLTLWLRVPLPWYTSATFAHFPDETRMSIKRSFVSPYTANTRRQFCGYCGTQLSSWNERTRDEAEHISLTVGSLLDEDQELLGDLGFLPSSSESSDDEVGAAGPSRPSSSRTVARPGPQSRGAPWFEEIVRNTRLGRFKQQRGGHTDSGVHVEWEVTEWTEGDDADDEGSATPSKRKIGDIDDGEDAEMRSA
ncbi:dimethylaniline monooxygenase 2 [Stemphylium lycopersici]|uniref:Dimethylaniline monooxygenase 2 n=1 Tax=Stemphylium lycopersici TaxID=183478 RepID=A0A364N684_STELY|nr:dimethylaniline monooxygenase 2 [Stemphylium lycopersici]